MWTIETFLPAQLMLIHFKQLRITNDRGAYDQLIQLAGELKRTYKNYSIGSIENVQAARRLFHAIRIDPTRRRPSSEALLNRALKGKEFFSVNSLVDVGNWCSLDFLLPICIYDANKIIGTVTIRQGRESDAYLALNHQEINFHQRYVIADEQGAFGSPMTDSLRTAVDLNTTQAVLGIWAPADYASQRLQQHAAVFAERVKKYCGGTVTQLVNLRNPSETDLLGESKLR